MNKFSKNQTKNYYHLILCNSTIRPAIFSYWYFGHNIGGMSDCISGCLSVGGLIYGTALLLSCPSSTMEKRPTMDNLRIICCANRHQRHLCIEVPDDKPWLNDWILHVFLFPHLLLDTISICMYT